MPLLAPVTTTVRPVRSGRSSEVQREEAMRRNVGSVAVPEPFRCFGGSDPLYAAYHDTEWGRPVVDDRLLLERICLEGFQSGLSWLTILRKRDGFRAALAGFDPERLAKFGDAHVERLLSDVAIVRHRGKIEAA